MYEIWKVHHYWKKFITSEDSKSSQKNDCHCCKGSSNRKRFTNGNHSSMVSIDDIDSMNGKDYLGDRL